jgi:hypothetical protein
MLLFQSACTNGTELDTPKPDRLSADGDATFREEIFFTFSDRELARLKAMRTSFSLTEHSAFERLIDSPNGPLENSTFIVKFFIITDS